jgi:hypothetical protein
MEVVNDSTVNGLDSGDAGGMEYSLWLAKVGLSRPTGYRYRRDRKVVTINIEGREFITTEEITRFWQRARAGEFAKKPRGASAQAGRASSQPSGCGRAQDGGIPSDSKALPPNGRRRTR